MLNKSKHMSCRTPPHSSLQACAEQNSSVGKDTIPHAPSFITHHPLHSSISGASDWKGPESSLALPSTPPLLHSSIPPKSDGWYGRRSIKEVDARRRGEVRQKGSKRRRVEGRNGEERKKGEERRGGGRCICICICM